MSRMFYGVLIYSILCLMLFLSYGYYTEVFKLEFFNYNLSFWSALTANLFLLSVSIISLKGPKLLPILGMVFAPVSTYLFYVSWTEKNYTYLAGFIAIPFVLLLGSMIVKIRQKYHTREQL